MVFDLKKKDVYLQLSWLAGFWIFLPQSFRNRSGASIEKHDSHSPELIPLREMTV